MVKKQRTPRIPIILSPALLVGALLFMVSAFIFIDTNKQGLNQVCVWSQSYQATLELLLFLGAVLVIGSLIVAIMHRSARYIGLATVVVLFSVVFVPYLLIMAAFACIE